MDGTKLVSGSHDCTVNVWDVFSGQCVRTLSHKGMFTEITVFNLIIWHFLSAFNGVLALGCQLKMVHPQCLKKELTNFDQFAILIDEYLAQDCYLASFVSSNLQLRLLAENHFHIISLEGLDGLHSVLTLVLLNPDMPCICKQCRSRSSGLIK